MKTYPHYLKLALLISIAVSQLAPAAIGAGDQDDNEPVGERGEKPKQDPAAMVPQFTFRAKDGKLLTQIMQKNKWYLEFRQTSFYQGAVGRIAPVLFTPPDDHGSAAKAWKGRLLDYLQQKILENRPVAIHYFRRSRLASPFAVSVSGLSKAEIAVANQLISSLKSGEPVVMKFRDAGSVSVTPLLVKQQKFGAILKDGCLSVGRSPEAVAAASYWCRQARPLQGDGEIGVSLDESFPALRGVREKFLGVMPELRVPMKWNSAEARFSVQPARLELADHALKTGKIPIELINALPSDALFFSSALVPMPASGFDPGGMQSYFKTPKAKLQKAPILPVALVYFPVNHEGKGPRPETALLLHVPKATDAAIAQLATSFTPTKKRETFVRKTCDGVIALSASKEALDALEQVCKKQRASFAQMADKWTTPLKTPALSGVAYLSPGRLFSTQIDRGWQKTKTQEPAEEIKTARHLVEKLPTYMFTGAAEPKSLVLKAVE